MNFEARYIDVDPPGDADAAVTAIWCPLNGRLRRFTADNVSDARAAGHGFYVRDAARAQHDVHVVKVGSPAAHLQSQSAGSEANVLRGLPCWDPD
jgi:hypothetical protein